MHRENENGGIPQTGNNVQPDITQAYKLVEAVGEIKDEYVIEAADIAEKASATAPRQITFKEPAATTAGGTASGEATATSKKPAARIARPVWQKALGIGGAVAAVAVVGVLSVGLMSPKAPSPTDTFTGSSDEDAGWSTSSVSESVDGEKATGWDASSMINSSSSAGDMSASESAYTSDVASVSADRSSSVPAPVDPEQVQDPVAPFMLTAGVWNDNDNWPFFTNLVSSGFVEFPSYGINPVNRVKVNVRNDAGQPMRGETVELKEEDRVLWTAKTDKNGCAYLFYNNGQHPTEARCGDSWDSLSINAADESGQGTTSAANVEANIVIGGTSKQVQGVQVAFIVDTTGSMSDELAYLQKDFSSIASETAAENVYFSTAFYKDEGDDYVVRSNGFTNDVNQIKSQLAAESASGGGDTPEAVAQVLTDVIVNNQEWNDDYAHIAFLIFDAPPHDGTDQEIDAAVRAAAAKGIHVVPVVASNAERNTELFGRALAICTGSSYVFLTDDSGIGNSHLEPIVGDYQVEKLHDIIVRLIREQGN